MKAKTTILSLTVAGAFLSAAGALRADGTCADCPECAPDKMTLQTPRMVEQFPSLARSSTEANSTTPRMSTAPAYAMTPRSLELRPGLTRTTISPARPAQATENHAVAASPRFLETHPAQARTAIQFEIAPLK